jgi:hypothetical protein
MIEKRQCGNCTKCCEGYLSGEALGYKFYQGKPCHFVSIGRGCTVYDKRPNDPCIVFKCEWLINKDVPEWMKPSDIKSIFISQKLNEITYYALVEAGDKLDSAVLTWCIKYALEHKLNFTWVVNNAHHWIGTQEFSNLMELKNNLV